MDCKRCGYIWKEKKSKPKQCPNCKQYYYNKKPLWKVERKKVEDYDPIIKEKEVPEQKEEPVGEESEEVLLK